MRDFNLPGRSPVLASNAIVATSHPIAAQEALAVLRAGGNAVDAAITGALLLGLCEPHMTGIGGDCFALIKPAGSNDVIALNGSGRAPRAADPEAVRAEGVQRIRPGHPASITVPGAIDAFCRMSDRFGRLGLSRSIEPVVEHFRAGVPVAPRVALDFSSHDEDIGTPKDHLKGAAGRHYLKDGNPYLLGDIFAQPAQADLLEKIASQGRDAFYTGEAAEDMLKALRAIGAPHTEEDFAATEATWSEPISGPYRRAELVEHPPNGQGATAILLAGILAEFDIAGMDPFGAERLHLEAEATKLAYDTRNRFLSDPDFMTRLDHMLDPGLAKALAAKIDPRRAMTSATALTEDVHKDTVLITVVDRDGMAVSLIYSIFATFGSGVATDTYGILLHNRGSGFNLTPGHPNEFGPGKRPMHTIIPAMSRVNGQVDMAFGVMGGQYQAAGHAHVLSNIIDYGMDVQEALDAPRVFADPISGKLKVESTISSDVRDALASMGHDVLVPQKPIGGAQAIRIDHDRGILVGGSDPRKDGCAVGY